MIVHLLHHSRALGNDVDEVKLVGVYATLEDAEAALLRASPQPGFRDYPDCFEITPYEVGEDHWTEGFITWAEAEALGSTEDKAPSA